MDDLTAVVILLIMFGVYFAILGLSLANYIVFSLSLYKIACKRKITNAWLSWLPIGCDWIMGSITDSFDEENGKSHSWRKVLLITSILTVLILYVSCIVMIVSAVIAALNGIVDDDLMSFAPFLFSYLGIIVGSLVSGVFTLVQIVCFYRIYDEICPSKTVKYLIFTFLIPLASAICMFKCSNRCPEKVTQENHVNIDENNVGLQPENCD